MLLLIGDTKRSNQVGGDCGSNATCLHKHDWLLWFGAIMMLVCRCVCCSVVCAPRRAEKYRCKYRCECLSLKLLAVSARLLALPINASFARNSIWALATLFRVSRGVADTKLTQHGMRVKLERI